MKKLFNSLCAVAALLVLPGCIESDTTVNLNKDGSGTLVIETLMSAQTLAMIGGMGGEEDAADPLEEMLSEESAREAGAKLGEGVTFEKVEPLERGGSRGGRITYKFEDINKLKLSPNSGLDAMAGEEGEGGEEIIRFAYADDKLTIKQPGGLNEEGGMLDMSDFPEEGGDPQGKAMMEMMLADMRVSIKVNFIPGIKETNATHRDGNVVTLTEVKFGQLLTDEGSLEKLRALKGKNEEEVKAAIKDIDGIKVDLNDEIVIELD